MDQLLHDSWEFWCQSEWNVEYLNYGLSIVLKAKAADLLLINVLCMHPLRTPYCVADNPFLPSEPISVDPIPPRELALALSVGSSQHPPGWTTFRPLSSATRSDSSCGADNEAGNRCSFWLDTKSQNTRITVNNFIYPYWNRNCKQPRPS
jgi:hypothetical protein